MKYAILDPKKVKYIIVHCSATYENMDIGFKEIDKWHKDNPNIGELGCGYHFIIKNKFTSETNGILEVGRSLKQVGAHTKGVNSQSIGICLVGGLKKIEGKDYPDKNFTQVQFNVLKKLIVTIRFIFPLVEIKGHRDFSNKECPCFDVKKWVEENNL